MCLWLSCKVHIRSITLAKPRTFQDTRTWYFMVDQISQASFVVLGMSLVDELNRIVCYFSVVRKSNSFLYGCKYTGKLRCERDFLSYISYMFVQNM